MQPSCSNTSKRYMQVKVKVKVVSAKSTLACSLASITTSSSTHLTRSALTLTLRTLLSPTDSKAAWIRSPMS